MMFNGDAKAIAEFVKAEPTLAQRVLAKIKEFIQALTGTSPDRQMTDTQKRLQKAQELFEQALRAERYSSSVQVHSGLTDAQIKTIQDYHRAVNEDALVAAEAIRKDINAKIEPVSFGRISSGTAQDLNKLLGVNVADYDMYANDHFFQHVENRHGIKGKERTMTVPADVARAGWVVNNYDTVDFLRDGNGDILLSREFSDSNHNKLPLIIFSKSIDRTIYTVEAVGENKKYQLHLVSAYMKKGLAINPQDPKRTGTDDAGQSRPRFDVQDVAVSPSVNNISQVSQPVNTSMDIKTDDEGGV